VALAVGGHVEGKARRGVSRGSGWATPIGWRRVRSGVYSLPGGGFGNPRDHESYLVEVREGKKKPKLYWPRVAALEKD
jgi:hypothetical protein